jgi:hypothetical protein
MCMYAHTYWCRCITCLFLCVRVACMHLRVSAHIFVHCAQSLDQRTPLRIFMPLLVTQDAKQAAGQGIQIRARGGGIHDRVSQGIHSPAHMHTCTHAHMHTCTHAHMHTCTYAYMHTCTHAYMHTCILTWPHLHYAPNMWNKLLHL